MKYCEKCGQELKSRVCQFCGQESKPVVSSIQQSSNNSQNHKFRWLRSDRPKRYLAEMGLLAIVALIALLVLIPSFQQEDLVAEVEPQQEEEQTEITEELSEPEIKKEIGNTEDPIEPESIKEINVDDENDVRTATEGDEPDKREEGNNTNSQEAPTEDSIEEAPAASIDEETELEPDPPIEDNPLEKNPESSLANEEEIERFAQWKDSFAFFFVSPVVEKGSNCVEGYCVRETLCLDFSQPNSNLLGNLEGTIKILSDSKFKEINQQFSFSEDQNQFCLNFLDENPEDLSKYVGDYRIEIKFPYYGTRIDIGTVHRFFDLSANLEAGFD